jgi:hypothetical protein
MFVIYGFVFSHCGFPSQAKKITYLAGGAGCIPSHPQRLSAPEKRSIYSCQVADAQMTV